MSFNGAAPARARNRRSPAKAARGYAWLQRGRARAGAESQWDAFPWEFVPVLQRGRGCGRCHPSGRFNGAAPARARNPAATEGRPRAPSLLQRGRARAGAESAASDNDTLGAILGFNGAAPARARNPIFLCLRAHGTPRFNGAAPARARNP